MKKLCIAIAALPLFTSLAFAGPDMNAAAKDVCKCLEGPNSQATRFMELAAEAQASGDQSELMSAQDDMRGIMEESSRCFGSLPAKYPEIDKSEDLQQEIMTMAHKQCPNPVFQISMK